jgi:hypothetical protein
MNAMTAIIAPAANIVCFFDWLMASPRVLVAGFHDPQGFIMSSGVIAIVSPLLREPCAFALIHKNGKRLPKLSSF